MRSSIFVSWKVLPESPSPRTHSPSTTKLTRIKITLHKSPSMLRKKRTSSNNRVMHNNKLRPTTLGRWGRPMKTISSATPTSLSLPYLNSQLNSWFLIAWEEAVYTLKTGLYCKSKWCQASHIPSCIATETRGAEPIWPLVLKSNRLIMWVCLRSYQ